MEDVINCREIKKCGNSLNLFDRTCCRKRFGVNPEILEIRFIVVLHSGRNKNAGGKRGREVEILKKYWEMLGKY